MKLSLFASLLCLTLPLAAARPLVMADRDLTIDFIDVEGGQATLFIMPNGQSLLIDTGWSGHDSRDAGRIADAAHKAGLNHLDYVLITHYHDDHVGGVPQLVARIPVGTFIDHGPNREPIPINVANYAAYQKVLATGLSRHIVAKPGDHFPIGNVDIAVISADGSLIDKPLPGAGQPNPACASSEVRPADQTENSRSLGVEITFGKLKILDLGDLTWDKEMQLMCPVNKLGRVDILVVSHHGWYQSSSPALVHAIHPRVAIMDNGESKGGSPQTFKTFAAAPGLEQLWQLHYSVESKTFNQPEKFIANLPGPDSANFLQLTATPTGSFTILNSRTNATQTYSAVH